MTKPALADELGSRLPSEQERMAANRLRQVLASHASEAITLRIIDEETKKPREIALPPGLSKLLTELLLHIGNGEAVTLVPVSKMLSTQQAADILGVSRPFLISLLDKGQIDHELVGRHRRINAETLFAYKRDRNAERSKTLDDLAALDGELLAQ